MEAMRALKRRLSDIVYRHLANDAIKHSVSSPGGQRETTLTQARPAHIPTPAPRISHFPDPSPSSLEPHCRLRLDTEGAMSARIAGMSGRSDR